jgi:hypothetical protein
MNTNFLGSLSTQRVYFYIGELNSQEMEKPNEILVKPMNLLKSLKPTVHLRNCVAYCRYHIAPICLEGDSCTEQHLQMEFY